MQIRPIEILAMMDRISESVTDDDAKPAVDEIRMLKLSGITPSMVLQELVINRNQPTPDYEPGRIQELARQVAELSRGNAQLEARVSELNEQLRNRDHYIEPTNGSYTMEQFLIILTARMRRSYGWRTDFIQASKTTPGCTPVSNEIVQKWQNTNTVPAWAVEQISRLEFKKRNGKTGTLSWSETDEEFLIQLHRDDPLEKNAVLAQRCAERFGRQITENSIKGALDRARKKGYLPNHRPARIR